MYFVEIRYWTEGRFRSISAYPVKLQVELIKKWTEYSFMRSPVSLSLSLSLYLSAACNYFLATTFHSRGGKVLVPVSYAATEDSKCRWYDGYNIVETHGVRIYGQSNVEATTASRIQNSSHQQEHQTQERDRYI